MSSIPTDQPEQGGVSVNKPSPLQRIYIPTEEEKAVLAECNKESFWYRSVPYAVVGMVATQAMVTKGILPPAYRLGSLPKVVAAGALGFLGGKISYLKTCQEKFKKLENSPIADAIRERSAGKQQNVTSELSDPDTQSFDTMFQPAEPQVQRNYNTESPVQMGRADDVSAPVQSYIEEEEPKRKSILYEDLRLKNRENYEVTLTQKAETLLKPTPEKEQKRTKKEMKNIYGDSWEE
ncbi:OCIA domain-containing protein 1 [Halichoeres trimaculatus]|uniref:OCIA domain-containing protein 1 n=1 Tax=Halichoeres trimaculatus TaxID=147232 RepID=UPI003D9F4CC0